ncbi:hypothetical protein E5673_14620 [Sphingomonas sp. PAMC26645]|uniref:hypothetical protein n=1 Tax=Sphingomonas sp. PAMC26645 TaxID=2565555 RepID=UPI00109E053B|nr:hypothetical protein [Sphingomonas sp. PAMC26645]QCB43305.1 hypothetical protein E5673_14620 [Sphingomonas sp. PAMC26645]
MGIAVVDTVAGDDHRDDDLHVAMSLEAIRHPGCRKRPPPGGKAVRRHLRIFPPPRRGACDRDDLAGRFLDRSQHFNWHASITCFIPRVAEKPRKPVCTPISGNAAVEWSSDQAINSFIRRLASRRVRFTTCR